MALASIDIEKHLPATISYPGLSDCEFDKICAEFPDAMVEYTSDGTLIIMPPTDPDSGAGVHLVNRRLGNWAERDGRGRVTGPDTGYRFLSGARLSPDAAWHDLKRWKVARKSGKRFPVFAPEFVIEVRSPDDRMSNLREKMQDYIDNGVLLGWLLDPIKHNVEIYRSGHPVEVLSNPTKIEGDGPVAGFVLDLDGIL
jgi:Uma2 family endonuclease